MVRIAEHPFDRVLAQHPEEERVFNATQLFILLLRREGGEAFELRDRISINLPRRCLSLIAMLRYGLGPGPLRVAKLVSAVRASKLPVNINDHTGFAGTRTVCVARKDPFARSRHYFRFGLGEEAQWNTHRAVLGLNAQRLAC